MASSEATTPDGIHPASTRRDFLYIATGTAVTVGAAAVLVPLIAQMNPDASTLAAGGPVDLDRHLAEEERRLIERALDRHRHNRRRAAVALGLSYDQLRARLRRLAIDAAA